MKTVRQLGSFLCLTCMIFVFSACEETTQKQEKETLTNPVDTYMNSRIDAVQRAKSMVEKNNKRTKAQEEVMKTLVK